MRRKAFGDAMAELHPEQQTGSADASESLSFGLEGDDATARTYRVLVASDYILLGSSKLPKDFLLDLQTRRPEA